MKSFCTVCHEMFNSLTAFDEHRKGSYREAIYCKSPTGKTEDIVGYTRPTRCCLTPDEMRAKGWSQNEKGWWITSQREGAGLPVEEAAD